MIYVDCNGVASPAILEATGGEGEAERLTAAAYYSGAPKKAFKFKVYKKPEVVELLESLFNSKCAYCETFYGASSPTDVEHFRPKGGVEEDDKHPGYWWLASRWNNLLPSCPDCNRQRYKKSYDYQSGTLINKAIKSGKKDSFPISGQRAYKEADNHDLENPLLINPRFIRPENHLVWKFFNQNKVGVVSPILDQDGNLDKHAVTSISVYGLNRRMLVEDRIRFLINLRNDAADIRAQLVLAVKEGVAAEVAEYCLINAQRLIDRFKARALSSEEFSAMANAFIKLTMDELVNDFSIALSKLNK